MLNKTSRPLILGILAITLPGCMTLAGDNRAHINAEPFSAKVEFAQQDVLIVDPASEAIYQHPRSDLPTTTLASIKTVGSASKPAFILLGSVPVERRLQLHRISF